MFTFTYCCEECGLQDAEVKVPLRESHEDVIAWMKLVIEPALVRDHALRSPKCMTEMFSDVKFPIEGREWLGGPVIN